MSGVASVITWWLTGDISEPGLVFPDYVVEPPHISPETETAIGTVALMSAAILLLVLWRGERHAVINSRQLAAAVPMAGIGAFVGLSFRVFTAAVIGANIGAGMMMMGSVVITPVLLGLARRLWRDNRPPGPTTVR